MANPEYEAVIVGAGPAGLSAALWAEELLLTSIVLETASEPGGQLMETYNPITNHLGSEASNGAELRDMFARQLDNRNVRIKCGSRVISVDPNKRVVGLESWTGAPAETIRYSYLVFGTGVSRRKLGIPGESEFLGNGILLSGKRDGKNAEGRNAVVIGGGDAAFENALILSRHAAQVTILHRRNVYSAREDFIEKVAQADNISVKANSEVTRFTGSGELESVFVRERGSAGESEIKAAIAVIRIGVEPNSGILKGLVRTDDLGFIEVNSECQTSDPQIFAVGDVANPLSPTVSTAVGMGATAIKSIQFRIP